MVGNDIKSKVGWIKSATTEHEIPTDHTSWLYSGTLGDPTLSDPTLRLKEESLMISPMKWPGLMEIL